MNVPSRFVRGSALLCTGLLGTVAGAASTPPADVPPLGELAGGIPIVDSVRTDRSTVLEVPLDRVRFVAFMLIPAAGELDLEMTSPSGKRFGPGSEATESSGYLQGGGDEEESDFDLFFGPARIVYLEDPEPGTWTVTVTAKEIPDSLEWAPFILSTLLRTGTGITLTPSVPDLATPRGDPLPLRVELRDGENPVLGADVEAIVQLPDETQARLPLKDDGAIPDSAAADGVYTGWLRPAEQVGEHWIHFIAKRSGSPGGEDFTRTGMDLTFVSASRSRFEDELQDRGRDDDGNGFYETVELEFGVRITHPGTYEVNCSLSDSSRKILNGHASYELEPGSHRLHLPIDAGWFHNHRSKGPLVLESLYLWEAADGVGPMLDRWERPYRTRSYDADLIESEPLRFIALSGATPIDRDGNGLYEALRVEVDVFMNAGGTYQWQSDLQDWDHNVIVKMNGFESALFEAGKQTIRFEFPGPCIRGLGIDGEYLLGHTRLYGPAGHISEWSMRLGKLFDHRNFEAAPLPREESPGTGLYRCNF